MATLTTSFSLPTHWTAADLQQHLGGIPLERIRLYPPPGMATAQDVIEAQAREDRICELVDGVLVEKTVGYDESRLAMLIGHFLHRYLETHDLGIVLGEAGTLRILPGQVRIPDVSFISWEHFPNRELPQEPIPDLVPDLAVEVLFPGNTAAEMQRKLREYFRAGTQLVWYLDPPSRSVRVYTHPDKGRVLQEDETLKGGSVLPGFELPLRALFGKTSKSS